MADIKNISKVSLEGQTYQVKDIAARNSIASAYSSTSAYNKKDLTIYNDGLYECTTPIKKGEAFNISHWKKVNISDIFLPIDSPKMSGVPTAPTAKKGTNTTQIATTGFVQEAITANNNYTLVNIVRW